MYIYRCAPTAAAVGRGAAGREGSPAGGAAWARARLLWG